MRLLFKGDYTEGSYPAGSICRFPDGFKVRTYHGTWEDTVAPDDLALFRDGRDAEPAKSFNPRGKWRRRQYEPLDVVTHEGSSYVAIAPTTSEPPGKAWQLLATRGEDGESYHTTRVVRHADTVSRVAVGFTELVALGDVVRIAGDNLASKALASGSDANALAAGLVSGVGEMQTSGPLTCETWNLTPGTAYFLDPNTPGALTPICPQNYGEYVIIVGLAITPTKLDIRIHWALKIDT